MEALAELQPTKGAARGRKQLNGFITARCHCRNVAGSMLAGDVAYALFFNFALQSTPHS
jgi:hypothetical protein